jgi:hypothetical protein
MALQLFVAPLQIYIRDNTRDNPPSIRELVNDICVYLSMLLEDKPRLSSLYRSGHRVGQRWPRRMHDIAPFDPIHCWHGLGAWEYLRDTPPFN